MNDLVAIEETTILQAFAPGGDVNVLTEQVREFVANFEHDMSTGASRAKTASLSAKVSKTKVKAAKVAKALIKEDEDKIKKVKLSIKELSADFDELRDLARMPLTDWEAEDAERKEAEAARIKAEELLAEFNNAHEMGLLLDEKFDRDLEDARIEAARIAEEMAEKAAQEAAELAAKQEADRIERDARIAQEAADKAIANENAKNRAAVAKVRLDKFNSDHEIALLTNDKMIADSEKIAADERAKVEAEQAETRRVEAEAKAERDALEAAENARLAEVKRQEYEAARDKAEQEKRDANTRNVSLKRKQAKEAFMLHAGLDEAAARRAVLALDKKLITNCSIKY